MDEEKPRERVVKCPSYGTVMQNIGSHTIRMGMTEISTGFGLLSPSVPVGIAVPFVIYICQSCGKAEFYVGEETEDMIRKTRNIGWAPKILPEEVRQMQERDPISI